tara:strand:+ start:35521 stop:36252 length:732 start_codon:yes stop_codon:yes gene_type:complete
LFACCLLESIAIAHIGSSERVNNRYYKLAPMADRVRIVYTIFFGREPSATLRRDMDRNRDGMLSDSEIAAYATSLQAEILTSTAATLDGREVKIRWKAADVGMGEATTSGGAFSADFVGSVCLDQKSSQAEHTLVFTDSLVLSKPGESELRLDPAPGIRIERSTIGGREIGVAGHKWQGGPGPAAQGYQLGFFVDRDDSAGLDDSCKPPPPKAGMRTSLIAGGALLLLLLAAAVVWRVSRASS